jgi:NADH-quinone oxidoreductase subunit J
MEINVQTCLFCVIAGLTGLCALMVVLTQNIVRAAAWLLFTLGGTAGVFFLLGADFIGATQLLVYVGGTLVLVVFGVMLTAQGPFITMKSGAPEWGIAFLVGGLLYGVIAFTVGSADTWKGVAKAPTEGNPATSDQTAVLGAVLLNVKDGVPEAKVTGLPDGAPSMTRTQVGYLLPFEIVSVHLLVVLIGAAYLARAKRRKAALPSPDLPEGDTP